MKAQLTKEQKKVIALALSGKSLFFTGSAGTGKSFVLRIMVEELQLKYGYNSVFVTASTGMAGCNIQGTTLHSFAGIGLGKGTPNELVEYVNKKKHVVQRWKRAKVLIIDEISMISASFFSKIEYVGRILRENEKPFGGLQVILCGDFFQLPPVKADDFCFESEAWKRCISVNVELKKVIRQKNPEFIKLLNEIRVGNLSNESRLILESRMINTTNSNVINYTDSNTTNDKNISSSSSLSNQNIINDHGIKPTKLYPNRCDVTQENRNNLLLEKSKNIFTFEAKDSGEYYFTQQLDSSCQAPKLLELKKGCQVMLLKNLDFKNTLVNGSRGIVVGFTTDSEQIIYYDEDDDKKSTIISSELNEIYPVVRFSDGKDRIITHETWKIESAGQIKATRYQIPLTLAYALSIHKSQGMSIEKVDLSLGKVFTYGQAYVALSRVTSLEGLRLFSFSPSIIRAHPKVISFYNSFKDYYSIDNNNSITTTNTSTQQKSIIDNETTSCDDDFSFWDDDDFKIDKKEKKEEEIPQITKSSYFSKDKSPPRINGRISPNSLSHSQLPFKITENPKVKRNIVVELD